MSVECTRETLVQAMSSLQQASAADMEGLSETAIALYQHSSERLSVLLPLVPIDHADVLAQHLASIKHRVDALKNDKVKGSNTRDFPKFPVHFSPQPVPVGDGPFSAPHQTALRPFWLMHAMSDSMQTGAYITPDLYVTKHVWLQNGALTAVPYVPQKVKFLTALSEAMEPLQQLSLADSTQVLAGLDVFLKEAEEAKQIFDHEVGKKTGSVPQRGRLERGFRELLHKGQNVLKSWKLQQDAEYNAYFAWAVNALEQSQLFHRWTIYYSHNEECQRTADVVERLHQVAAFFYFGVCIFLLQDMFVLLGRYLAKSRESLSRLLPSDVKFEGPQHQHS